MVVAPQEHSRGPVVLLSGGIDSTVALAIARERYSKDIIAVTFDYGQVNRSQELRSSREVAQHYGVEHRIVGLGSAFIPSALTGRGEIPSAPAVDGPDATFVPGRNMVLISVGVAIAQGSGSGVVVTGCNADDAAGYPDTTLAFLGSLFAAAKIGYGVELVNPLLGLGKKEIIDVANGFRAPIGLTWSCYRSGDVQCGECGSCALNGGAAAL